MKRHSSKKIVLIRRNVIVAIGLILCVIAIFTVINHPAIVGSHNRERIVPIYSVQRDDNAIALTFNVTAIQDRGTQQVMDTLNAHGVTATFFVTGDWIRANEYLAVALIASGHELKNLSDDHSLLRKLDPPALYANISGCNDAIAALTGERPTMFRAPYGEYNGQIVHLVNAMGMQAVQWSIDSGDWRRLDASAITNTVVNRAFPGAIVLLHSNLEQTVQALDGIVQQLLDAEFSLVPLSDLLHQAEYTVSATGKQKPVLGR